VATLNYHRQGTGEPLLLAHGIGSRWQMWMPVLERLAAERDVIAVDLPGFAASPPSPPGTPPGIASLADALERFLDDLGIDTTHIGGNSLGGSAALELAKRGRARSATALSPAGFYNDREGAFARTSLRLSVRVARLLAPNAELILASAVGRTALLGQLFGRPWKVPVQDAVEHLRAFAAAPSFDATLDAISHERFRDGEAIDVPVTIAWGQRDFVLIPRQGRRAVRAIPGARLATLHGCGHVPTYDDPRLVAEVLLAGSRPAPIAPARRESAATAR
jgi:pimeloyl-ACP methyl ester carboxylesterase